MSNYIPMNLRRITDFEDPDEIIVLSFISILYCLSSRGRGEGKKAADCLRIALRDYNLKFATILNDPDLASFRALPEFKELQEEVLYSPFSFLILII